MSFIPYLFTTAILVAMFTFASSSKQSTLSYGQLINLIESKQINQVQLTMNSTVIDVKGTYTEKDIEYIFVSSIPNNETQSSELMELLKEKVTDGNIKIVNPYKTNVLTEILAQVIPMFLLVGLCIYMFSKVSMASNNKAADYQKSRARLEGDIKVRFNDVAGCDEEKEEMQELRIFS